MTVRDPDRGRIPFVLRVGVAGHRSLPDGAGIQVKVKDAVGRIRSLFPSTSSTRVTLVAVSNLAEGADRLVAETILREEGTLEVCLPLAPADYVDDFTTPSSINRFLELLGRASSVIQGPLSGSRQERYELSGRYVVDRCDILIAVWDGQPARGQGGTADTVRYALDSRVPVLLVGLDAGRGIAEDLGTGKCPEAFGASGAARTRADDGSGPSPRLMATRAIFRRLDSFNRFSISQERFEQRVAREKVLSSTSPSVDPQMTMADWAIPPRVRADSIALSLERRYFALIRLEFLLAAFAVAVLGLQAVFFPERPYLAFVELGFLVTLGAIVWIGRRLSLHERWISTRYLAERLRAAFYLAAVGLSDRRQGGFAGASDTSDGKEWVRRSFGCVWDHRPRIHVEEMHLDELRHLLVTSWIDRQIDYHDESSRRHESWYTTLTIVTIVLFTLTAAAAIVHGSDLWPPGSWIGQVVVLLAIALPAFGAAIAGIAAHGEHQRLANAYEGMSGALKVTRTKLVTAMDITALQAAAAEADQVMSQENGEWLGAMWFHDFELHV